MVYFLRQIRHWNFFLLAKAELKCILKCLFKFPFCANLSLHSVHLKGFSLVWILEWYTKFHDFVNSFLQFLKQQINILRDFPVLSSIFMAISWGYWFMFSDWLKFEISCDDSGYLLLESEIEINLVVSQPSPVFLASWSLGHFVLFSKKTPNFCWG